MGLVDILKDRIPFLKRKEEDIASNKSSDASLGSRTGSDDSALKTPGLNDIPDNLSNPSSDPFSPSSKQDFSASKMGFDSQRSSSEASNISQELLLAKIDGMKAKIEVLEHKIDKVLDLLKNVY